MLGLNRARAVVLGISLLTMVGAYMLISPASLPEPVQMAMPSSTASVEVLVAAVELPMGNAVTANDVRWASWPADGVAQGMIRKDEAGALEKDIIGALVRSSFFINEPMRREKLIKADGSGFLAAILPSGKRAIAISIDRAGNSTAGGFVLPNDRVDVIKTGQQDSGAAARDNLSSETILTNIRVLAIGPNIQERNGEKVIVGETATLELDPNQTETIALAQRAGTLSLALRSLADANKPVDPVDVNGRQSLTLVRFGVTTQSAKP